MESATVFGLPAILSICAAGIVATALMSAFVLSFTRTIVLPVNPLEAIGAMFTRSEREAWRIGLLMHTSVGIGAAFLYAYLLRAAGMTGLLLPIGAAAMIGLIHGYVLSFIIVISLGENGTTSEIRTQGMSQAGVYLVAHIIYGLSLGIMFSLLPNALLA